MGTVPTNPVMIDVLDTFYSYISTNLATLNPQLTNLDFQMCGIVNAQDWPQTELVDGGLYLLYLSSVPIPEQSTRAQTYFEHYVQWAWVFLGTDIAADQVSMNRGDRYRNDMVIVEALRQAHFPGYCQKQFSQCDSTTGAVTFTSYSPVEMIHWGMPRLGTKMANAQSGILYGTAPLEVYGFSTVNPLLNV
jgi:hypothetical protein